jgi:hypothetical protein
MHMGWLPATGSGGTYYGTRNPRPSSDNEDVIEDVTEDVIEAVII